MTIIFINNDANDHHDYIDVDGGVMKMVTMVMMIMMKMIMLMLIFVLQFMCLYRRLFDTHTKVRDPLFHTLLI